MSFHTCRKHVCLPNLTVGRGRDTILVFYLRFETFLLWWLKNCIFIPISKGNISVLKFYFKWKTETHPLAPITVDLPANNNETVVANVPGEHPAMLFAFQELPQLILTNNSWSLSTFIAAATKSQTGEVTFPQSWTKVLSMTHDTQNGHCPVLHSVIYLWQNDKTEGWTANRYL